MGVDFHLSSAFRTRRIDLGFLRFLEERLADLEYEVHEIRVFDEHGFPIEASVPSLTALDSGSLSQHIVFETVSREKSPGMRVWVNPSAPRDPVCEEDVWPIRIDVSDKLVSHWYHQGGFRLESFAAEIHRRLEASKSTCWHDSWPFGMEDYPSIEQELAPYIHGDLVLHPMMDFVIFDPQEYDLKSFREVHEKWAELTSEQVSDPFPLSTRRLDNGHVFFQAR